MVAGDVPAPKNVMGEITRSAVVETTQTWVVEECADTKANTNVNGKPRTDDRSAKAVEANKSWTPEADPSAVPPVVDVYKNTRRIDNTVGPSIGIRSHACVARPWSVANAVVPYFDVYLAVVIHADHLVRAINL